MSYPVAVLGKFNLVGVIVLVSREIFSRWEIWKGESSAMFYIYLSAINSVQFVFFAKGRGKPFVADPNPFASSIHDFQIFPVSFLFVGV